MRRKDRREARSQPRQGTSRCSPPGVLWRRNRFSRALRKFLKYILRRRQRLELRFELERRLAIVTIISSRVRRAASSKSSASLSLETGSVARCPHATITTTCSCEVLPGVARHGRPCTQVQGWMRWLQLVHERIQLSEIQNTFRRRQSLAMRLRSARRLSSHSTCLVRNWRRSRRICASWIVRAGTSSMLHNLPRSRDGYDTKH